MATSSSKSTLTYASAFDNLFEAISLLEELNSRPSSYHTAHSFEARSVSQVTVADNVSQITVSNVASVVGTAEAPSSRTFVNSVREGEAPKQAGLPGDKEGRETRSEMLKRRRKECSAEEVDVALAPVMKINVPYVFYPEQYKRFRMLFPRINVDSGLSYIHHDHPVAHTATMVGIRYMQSMLEPGETALDLHGNPNGNEQYNRFQESRVKKRPHLGRSYIETLVEEKCAADSVRRVTKWGPEFGIDGSRRYHQMPIDNIPDKLYTTFLSVHTLYYYSMYSVCQLLAKNPGSRMVCLVNYSKEQQGTLYGELSFSKSGGMTTQTSPNNERYHHPDVDQWFQTNSFRPHFDTFNTGIAWTSHQIGGPLYVITITSCDLGLARTHRYDPPGAPTLKVQADRSFLGLVRIGGKNVQLRISNVDLASELRRFMTFRDRSDPEVFKELCVKARRCASADVVEGARAFSVNDGELQDHIAYAFCVDAPGELELLDGIKLLRGDVLVPLATALKFEGPLNKTSYFHAMFQWAVGEEKVAGALGARAKHKKIPENRLNTGGLLPFART